MILHCPCCHAQFSIEAIIQDEAARELLSMKADLPPATFSYLALFRSEKRALSWERALRLVREVVDIGKGDACVAPTGLDAAMAETVEALRGKGGAPLKNHNYLKRVLETVGRSPSGGELVCRDASVPRRDAPLSKTAEALTRLENWKHG